MVLRKMEIIEEEEKCFFMQTSCSRPFLTLRRGSEIIDGSVNNVIFLGVGFCKTICKANY